MPIEPIEPEEPEDIAPPEPPMPLEGAILPGGAPGAGEAAAAFGAPVGAGELEVVWAIATPAVKQSAAEASHSERMQILLKWLQNQRTRSEFPPVLVPESGRHRRWNKFFKV